MMTVLNTPFGVERAGAFRRELELIRMIAARTLKVRYRGTALGVLWSFANPILMTFLYTAIFGTAFAAYYGSRTLYVLSAFVGVSVVSYFLQTTGDAIGSVVGNGPMLNKVAVPREVFPMASVAANTFQQCITTFPVLILVTLVLSHSPLRALLAAVVLTAFVTLTLGFSLALSALFVFFRDLPHLWAILGFVLWLTSPVFYPAELVPGSIRSWLSVNPVGQLMTVLRELVVGHGSIQWVAVGSSIITAIVVLGAGAALFRATRNDFMDLL